MLPIRRARVHAEIVDLVGGQQLRRAKEVDGEAVPPPSPEESERALDERRGHEQLVTRGTVVLLPS